MAILIKDMEMPSECHGCRWFYFQGISCTEPRYYLDARCELVESGQDWYGKDSRGGWVGESIEHIPGWAGYYSHKHCVEEGLRASQCPLCELPSAQPTLHGYNIKHLELIAMILQKEDLPPERITEALTDIGRIVAIVRNEFEETLRRAVQDTERKTDERQT